MMKNGECKISGGHGMDGLGGQIMARSEERGDSDHERDQDRLKARSNWAIPPK